MSSILYYSNFCENSKNILKLLAQSSAKNDMHFICIDKRFKKENGAVYVLLENNQEILLPPSVTQVPALLLLNRGHHVIFGNDIEKFIQPQHNALKNNATMMNGEPQAYLFGGQGSGSGFGVSSDNYSFLDQDADSLSAKGNGGMRQIHHYATLEHVDTIETPPDTYEADTVGNIDMDSYQQKRASEINIPK